ncbi:hypothetical protein GUJ93_ZPchr0001g29892 [Zizania palustris]|uniref:Uncharacterized protein n=1 Tax=Zizania palustris TaxID=103762 RepID=A0A8J5R6M3_ZIZPA|nr:hypothetical protein GUJ93_ZPchr0001g29892 [Zizania palustris]
MATKPVHAEPSYVGCRTAGQSPQNTESIPQMGAPARIRGLRRHPKGSRAGSPVRHQTKTLRRPKASKGVPEDSPAGGLMWDPSCFDGLQKTTTKPFVSLQNDKEYYIESHPSHYNDVFVSQGADSYYGCSEGLNVNPKGAKGEGFVGSFKRGPRANLRAAEDNINGRLHDGCVQGQDFITIDDVQHHGGDDKVASENAKGYSDGKHTVNDSESESSEDGCKEEGDDEGNDRDGSPVRSSLQDVPLSSEAKDMERLDQRVSFLHTFVPSRGALDGLLESYLLVYQDMTWNQLVVVVAEHHHRDMYYAAGEALVGNPRSTRDRILGY